MGDVIEITDEMISAAASEIIWYDIETNDPKRIVKAILVAMGAVPGPMGDCFYLRSTQGVEGGGQQKAGLVALIGHPGHWKTLRLD